jgi:hypothetical protein
LTAIHFAHFFFCEILKIRDKAQRNIYNFQFHQQLRKPVGGFLFAKANVAPLTADDPPGLFSQVS